MRNEDKENIQLRNRLNDLCLLRLFRNTKKEFGEYIEYNLTTNNSILKIKPFTARCLYRELSSQIFSDTYSTFEIDKELEEYQKASDIYLNKIKKKRIDLQEPKLLYSFLRYYYTDGLQEPDYKNKDLDKLIHIVNKNNEVDVPFLLLLILKILPPYNSKQGDVKDINADFARVYHFFEGFVKDSPNLTELPVLEIMKHTFNQCTHKNRIFLIDMTKRILGCFCALTNPGDAYDSNAVSDKKVPNIDECYWYDTDTSSDTTTFWQFEQMATFDYFLYRYKIKIDRKEVEYNKFEVSFFNNLNYLTLYAAKSSSILEFIIEKKIIQMDKQAWYKCKLDNETFPNKIELCEILAGEPFLGFKTLSRLTDSKKEEQITNRIKEHKSINAKDNPEENEYTFLSAPIAITEKFIYIQMDNSEEEENENNNQHYYRISKENNEGLKKIMLNDFVGILTIQNRKYIGFSPLSLFLEVTDEKALIENKVEVVDRIIL